MRIDIVQASEPDSNYYYSNEYFRFEKAGEHSDSLLGDWNVDDTTVYGRSVEIATGISTWFNMNTTEEMGEPNSSVLENCYVIWKQRKEYEQRNTASLFEEVKK